MCFINKYHVIQSYKFIEWKTSAVVRFLCTNFFLKKHGAWKCMENNFLLVVKYTDVYWKIRFSKTEKNVRYASKTKNNMRIFVCIRLFGLLSVVYLIYQWWWKKSGFFGSIRIRILGFRNPAFDLNSDFRAKIWILDSKTSVF